MLSVQVPDMSGLSVPVPVRGAIAASQGSERRDRPR